MEEIAPSWTPPTTWRPHSRAVVDFVLSDESPLSEKEKGHLRQLQRIGSLNEVPRVSRLAAVVPFFVDAPGYAVVVLPTKKDVEAFGQMLVKDQFLMKPDEKRSQLGFSGRWSFVTIRELKKMDEEQLDAFWEGAGVALVGTEPGLGNLYRCPKLVTFFNARR